MDDPTSTSVEQRQQEHVILGSSLGQEQQQQSEIRLVANYTTETYTYYCYPHHDRSCPGNRSSSSHEEEELLQQQEEQQQDEKHHTPLHVQIESATTTQGGHLVSEGSHDLTGIMIWPATHFLCQYLCFSFGSMTSTTGSSSSTNKDANNNGNSNNPLSPPPPLCIGKATTVVELGCGCGLLGVTALKFAMTMKQQQHDDMDGFLWVSTDMDERALSLCQRNYALNGINVCDKSNIDRHDNINHDNIVAALSTLSCHVQQLRWGDQKAIEATLSILEEHHHRRQRENSMEESTTTTTTRPRFDAVVGADIVYPATSLIILKDLFDTVDQLLSLDGGSFWLSFATRDGHKTPVKLIQAASEAGFTISCVDDMNDAQKKILKQLPPLLDSKILVLQRNAKALELNASLGKEGCAVFPGLQSTIDRLDQQSSSDEEWEPPFFNEDDDDDT